MRRFRLGPGFFYLLPVLIFSLGLAGWGKRPLGLIVAFSLLIYFLIALLLLFIFSLTFKIQRPRLTFSLKNPELFEGEALLAFSRPLISQALILLARLPPLVLRQRLSFAVMGGTRSFKLEGSPLKDKTLTSSPLLRGSYQLLENSLLLGDALACFSLVLAPEKTGEFLVNVLPVPWRGEIRVLEAAGGEILRSGDMRVKTEDLGESRKYHPGDDPRKINWKLYAHSEELFLRSHEENPPPKGRLSLYIDTSVDGGLFSRPEEALDALARFASTLVAQAQGRGYEFSLRILFPAGKNGGEVGGALLFAEVKADQARQELAGQELAGQTLMGQTLAGHLLASMLPAKPEHRFSPKSGEYIHALSLPHSQGLSPALQDLFSHSGKTGGSLNSGGIKMEGTHILIPEGRTFRRHKALQSPLLAESGLALSRSKGCRYAQSYQS